MSASQVNKGKAGERELIHHLRDLLGIELTRNLDQAREGGSDILGLAGWIIECKRSQKPCITSWWAQTVHQARANEAKPALCYRVDRCQWRVIMALRHLVPGFEKAPHTLWLETSLDVFAAIVREQTTPLAVKPEKAQQPESLEGLTAEDLAWHRHWKTKAKAKRDKLETEPCSISA